jgi:hypothetical protein
LVGHACEVATWAGISEPAVRLFQPDGRLVDEVSPASVGQGVLRSKVIALSASTTSVAGLKLEALAQRFFGALKHEILSCPISESIGRMQQSGLQNLQNSDTVLGDERSFLALCQNCSAGEVTRIRHVASLARILRNTPPGASLAPLDLARRLVTLKLVGGSKPGAREALELLLNAVLFAGFDDEGVDPKRMSLALQFVVGCFGLEGLAELLLPVTGRLVQAKAWATMWTAGWDTGKDHNRARDSAQALLLNASVALRTSRFRAEYRVHFQAAIIALHLEPSSERLNLVAGNLLAVGRIPEDAKQALQAQRLPPLRALAAAVFRGELESPNVCAFLAAWHPAGSLS